MGRTETDRHAIFAGQPLTPQDQLKCTVLALQEQGVRCLRLAFDRVDEVAWRGVGTAIGQDRSQVAKIDGRFARRIAGPKEP
jgi:hypothetical protein